MTAVCTERDVNETVFHNRCRIDVVADDISSTVVTGKCVVASVQSGYEVHRRHV
jgi:hypothetical protein